MSRNQAKELNAIKAVIDVLSPFKKEEKERILRFSGELSETLEVSSVTISSTMELLFRIFKDSIEETNADKEYWLDQLSEHQKVAEALSDYLSDLAGHLMPDNGNSCNNDSDDDVEIRSLSADVTKKLGDLNFKLEVPDSVFEKTQRLRLSPKQIYVEIKLNLDLFKKTNNSKKIIYQKFRETDKNVNDRLKLQNSALKAIKQISSVID
jgi:hypothetical protein